MKLKLVILICSVLIGNFLYSATITMKDEVIQGSMALLTSTKMAKASSGDKIYYIGSDGKVYFSDLSITNFPTTCLNTLCANTPILAIAGSDLKVDGTHIYYIGTNNKLMNYWHDGTNWYCDPLNSSAQNVITGGGISIDEYSRVFYIGSNGIIYQCSWTGIWNVVPMPQPAQPAKVYSDLITKNGHIFYVGTDSKIYNYYWAGSWQVGVLNGSAPLVKAGSNIEIDESDNILYLDATSSYLQRFSWTPTAGWTASPASAVPMQPFSSPLVDVSNKRIFYIGENTYTVNFLFNNNGTWTTNDINFQQGTGTGLPYSIGPSLLIANNGEIIYLNSQDNKLHVLSPLITWKSEVIAQNLTAYAWEAGGWNAVSETSIIRQKRPVNYQFYARNSSNIGIIPCEGNCWSYINIVFKIEKTDYLGNTSSVISSSFPMNANGDFIGSLNINAELSEYKISYKLSGQNKFTLLADKIVCGDAFIASGQSNIQAEEYVVSTDEAYLNNTYGPNTLAGKYNRTYGSSNYYWCNNWNIPSGTFGNSSNWCPGSVGALVLPLEYKIAQNYHIPVCIINNGLGNTSIDDHQIRSGGNGNQFYFEFGINNQWAFKNIEGFLLRRVYEAGLENGVRGFIWYQGEAETNPSFSYTSGLYKQKFKQLFDDLKTYIPSLGSNNTRTYLVQIHSFSSQDNGHLKSPLVSEDQRTISSYIPYANIRVVSSNGAKYPNCQGIHFNLPGYEEIATRIFNAMKTDIYGAPYSIVDFPPNIVSAGLDNSLQTLTLTFDQVIDSANSNTDLEILSAVKVSNNAILSNPQRNGNRFTFNVSATTGLTSVNYLGELPCGSTTSQGCTGAYTSSSAYGWWCPSYVRNSNNIAALSFANFPVTIIPPGRSMQIFDQLTEKNSKENIECYPLSSTGEITVKSPINIDKITLYNSQGAIIESIEPFSTIQKFDLSTKTAGMYFFQIETKNQKVLKKITLIK